uniref:Piwi domain-containing protein n=1 Tax=Panagrolaimus superbus TaxID=310955 RepID=A0A914Y0T2_9BILA
MVHFFYGETRDEIIENTSLEKYIQIQFQEALKYRNEIETIAVIRDGIDEGRFLKVVEEEVQAIKTAAKNLGIDAKFVVFLINKKTNARHFQINKESNIITSMPPRSFISFGTRYMFKQIFMTAHRSITGTAVNTLITLPHDEIGISKAEGQEFLLGLCYLHQVVNAPISIPTSLHQADEIAFRGQYLYRKMYPPYKNYEREKLGNDELTRLLNFGDSLIPGTRYNA